MIKNTSSPIKMRPAFSMITAIFVMVLMALVAALIVNLSGKTVQETTTQYRKEQAILLAKSYTELAIMAATANNCVAPVILGSALGTPEEVLSGNGYHIRTNIRYIGTNAPVTCAKSIGNAIGNLASIDNIILIDVFVEYRDPLHQDAIDNTAWATVPGRTGGIVYHKRTLARL